MNGFERNKLFCYLANFLSKKANIREFLIRIGEWYEDYGSNYINCKLMSEEEIDKYNNFEDFAKKKKCEAMKRIDMLYHKVASKVEATKSSHFSSLQQKINLVADLIKLSDIEKDILGYYVRLKFNSEVEQLKETLFRRCNNNHLCSSFFLSYTPNQIENYLNSDDKLIACGMLEMEYDGDISLGERGVKLFSHKFRTLNDLRRIILGEHLLPSLDWQDFKHIENKDFCVKLLKGGSKYKGMNILFYGDPGTGKTEFAKTLCHKAKVELYAIGEKIGDDKNRLECLNMAQNTIDKGNKVCFLIDEADDLMFEKKIHINRILEKNETPCIWIVNSIRCWDKAYLRRFTYALDFKKPSIDIRKEIFKKTLKQYNIKIDSKKAAELAKEYNLTPSFITTAAKSAKIVKGGIKEVCQNLDAMEKAYNNGVEKHKPTEKRKKDDKKQLNFNVSLLNTDTDLGKLAEQIKELKKTKFSLCLYGVSGTGKSAYAEYLAEQLKMTIVKKRCSDLLSMWHGETEHNIAQAFQEAKDKRALLVFDEADSFLYNRQSSQHSWEVAQVNEMLTQMEKHELPFVCTTNLMDNLDKASLRRFTFKVEYKYMTSKQNSLAFEHFFGIKNVDLSHISSLTPGDFVVVKEKAEIMGCLDKREELIKMLEMEQKEKAPIARRIGFC